MQANAFVKEKECQESAEIQDCSSSHRFEDSVDVSHDAAGLRTALVQYALHKPSPPPVPDDRQRPGRF